MLRALALGLIGSLLRSAGAIADRCTLNATIQGIWPAATDVDSNNAWPYNEQPKSLSCWPKDTSGAPLAKCPYGNPKGAVHVLKAMDHEIVIALKRVDFFPTGPNDTNATSSKEACQKICYDDIYCQYWQHRKDGCFREDKTHPVPYPLTKADVDVTGIDPSEVGEYILHYCEDKFPLVPTHVVPNEARSEGCDGAASFFMSLTSWDVGIGSNVTKGETIGKAYSHNCLKNKNVTIKAPCNGTVIYKTVFPGETFLPEDSALWIAPDEYVAPPKLPAWLTGQKGGITEKPSESTKPPAITGTPAPTKAAGEGGGSSTTGGEGGSGSTTTKEGGGGGEGGAKKTTTEEKTTSKSTTKKTTTTTTTEAEEGEHKGGAGGGGGEEAKSSTTTKETKPPTTTTTTTTTTKKTKPTTTTTTTTTTESPDQLLKELGDDAYVIKLEEDDLPEEAKKDPSAHFVLDSFMVESGDVQSIGDPIGKIHVEGAKGVINITEAKSKLNKDTERRLSLRSSRALEEIPEDEEITLHCESDAEVVWVWPAKKGSVVPLGKPLVIMRKKKEIPIWWWLLLFLALLLCCLLCCFYFYREDEEQPANTQQQQEERKPLVAAAAPTPRQDPIPAGPPPPPPEPAAPPPAAAAAAAPVVAAAAAATAVAAAAPEPEKPKTRIDFEDEKKNVHSFNFEHHPIGIVFTRKAPIKVDDFFKCNSLAKKMGVQKGWAIVRIQNHNVLKDHDFQHVDKLLIESLKPLPTNPLEIEFLTPTQEQRIVKLAKHPLGFEFSKHAPFKVTKLTQNSNEAVGQGLEMGWQIKRVAEHEVTTNTGHKELNEWLMEGLKHLPHGQQ